MIGKTISHYKIIEKLGEGGMGVVYKAEDTSLKREVALKFLTSKALGNEDERSRFIHEARSAAALNHPNICTVFEIDDKDGHAFIAMSYIDGPSLEERIREGPMKISDVIEIGSQLTMGLHEAHEKGVVHRDIKPANIMISSRGEPVIMDFGLAKSAARSKLTQESTTLGTVAYMSPEQARGEKVDHRSDIWSLGVVLYQMVTGKLPFNSDYEQALIYSILNEDPEPMTGLRTGVPMGLEHLVDKALTKNRDERYQRIEEMLVDFKRLMSGASRISRVSSPDFQKQPKEKTGATGKKKDHTQSAGTPLFSGVKTRITIAVTVVLAAVAVMLFQFLSRSADEPSPGNRPRVVVSAFENLTGEATLDHLGRMAADWITQGLARTDLVDVVPFSTMESARSDASGTAGSGTYVIVSGAYYLQGENVQFHAQIADGLEGKILSAVGPMAGPVGDPVQPVEVLQQRVMGALAIIVDPRFRALTEVAGQPPLYDAYREYSEGERLLLVRDYEGALHRFLRSAALDTSYVQPIFHSAIARMKMGDYAGADSILNRFGPRREQLTPMDAHLFEWLEATLRGDYPAAFEACGLAVDLSPDSSWLLQLACNAVNSNHPGAALEVMEGIGPMTPQAGESCPFWTVKSAAFHMLGKHEEELAVAREGREMNPGSIEALYLEARALAAIGKFEETDAILSECLTYAPEGGLTPGLLITMVAKEQRQHGYRESALGSLDRAIDWFKSRPDSESEKEEHRHSLAIALYTAERWDEAWVLMENLAYEAPDNVVYQGCLGMLAARRGDREVALRISDKLAGGDDPYLFGVHTRQRASIAALLGEKENAVGLLREALAQGVRQTDLHPDMNMEALLDYPPYLELLIPKE